MYTVGRLCMKHTSCGSKWTSTEIHEHEVENVDIGDLIRVYELEMSMVVKFKGRVKRG